MADEVQTFKALITIHKVLQEGHPIALKEAQSNVHWLESLARGVSGGDGMRGTPKEIPRRTSTTTDHRRLRTLDLGIRLLPDCQTAVPQKPPGVQR